MAEFKTTGVEEGETRPPDQGLWLLLLYADRIPPHLGLLYRERYYSLSTEGRSVGSDSTELFRLIGMKQIPTLFIELFPEEEKDLEPGLHRAFASRRDLEGASATCLDPIRDFLADEQRIPVEEAGLVHELLPILMDHGVVGKKLQVHLTHRLQENTFTMECYTRADVESRIRQLQRSPDIDP